METGCSKFAFSGKPLVTVAADIVPVPRLVVGASEIMGDEAAILVGSVKLSAMLLAPSTVGRTRKESPATAAPLVICSVMPVPRTAFPGGARSDAIND